MESILFFGHAFLFNLPLQRNRDIPRLARLETRRIYFIQVSLSLSLCVIRIKTTRKETKRGARSQIYENKGETERFDSINAAYNLFFFYFLASRVIIQSAKSVGFTL